MIELYSIRDVSRILALQESRLRYWTQVGFVGPTVRKGGRFYYTFCDLVAVKGVVGQPRSGRQRRAGPRLVVEDAVDNGRLGQARGTHGRRCGWVLGRDCRVAMAEQGHGGAERPEASDEDPGDVHKSGRRILMLRSWHIKGRMEGRMLG